MEGDTIELVVCALLYRDWLPFPTFKRLVLKPLFYACPTLVIDSVIPSLISLQPLWALQCATRWS